MKKWMKLVMVITVLLVIFVLGCDETTGGDDPKPVTVNVNGSDAIDISSDATLVDDLTAGTYTVTASGFASPVSPAQYMGIYIQFMDGNADVQLVAVPVDGSISVDYGYSLYVFLTDGGTTSDNSGSISVSFSGPTSTSVTVNGSDAIDISSDATLVDDLTVGTYTVTASGYASPVSPAQYMGIYIQFMDGNADAQLVAVPVDGSISIDYGYSLYVFLTDGGTTSDNSGSITVQFSK